MSDSEEDSIIMLGYILKEILNNSDNIHNGVYISLDDSGTLVLDGRIRLNSVQIPVVQANIPKD